MQSSTPRSSSLSPDGAALAGEPLVDVFRGARLESRHHVAACAVDARGTVLFRLGTVDVPVFLRSSAKPFIAGAVVRGGAADAFGFDARDLALISASHGGEPGHIEGVRAILRKAGVEESALRCGAHPPLHEPSAQALSARCEQPTAIHNNCSGKHAGILALAKHLGADLATYLEAGNPAQREILALCERVVGERFEGDRLAVDGCGIPVFATTLRNAAHAFARFATLDELDARDAEALRRVREAMIARAWYVGGTDRFDTALIEAAGGTIAGKGGAEGVHCDALIARGAGVALKVVDGTRRAVPPATLAVLGTLEALDDAASAKLDSFRRPAVRNVGGRTVGEIRAETLPRPLV